MNAMKQERFLTTDEAFNSTTGVFRDRWKLGLREYRPQVEGRDKGQILLSKESILSVYSCGCLTLTSKDKLTTQTKRSNSHHRPSKVLRGSNVFSREI